MRFGLQFVPERLELRRFAGAVGERLREEPVGEPRVAGEEGAVEVGADHAAGTAALVAAGTVVAEAGEHAPERLGAFVEVRAARVVLEARQRTRLARLELALEQHVPDHAALPGNRVEGQEPSPGQLVAALVAIGAPEELVAAADGQRRGSARDSLP